VRELFAGCAELTRQLHIAGLACRSAMEAFPSRRRYVRVHDLDQLDVFEALLSEVIGGRYSYIHFGVPCSWWSSLSKINHSSRRVTKPDGVFPLLEVEMKSALQAERVAILCLALDRVGALFTVENPLQSLIFASSPFRRLGELVITYSVAFDQCMFGLQLPGHQPHVFCKKSTKILGNFPGLLSLEKRCPGRSEGHEHEHAIGSRSVVVDGQSKNVSLARCAGRYPPKLCRNLAHVIVAELLQRQQRYGGRYGFWEDLLYARSG